MNRRLLPPMHLLRAFIATAELKTVSAAADTLHLTQGAVSRQVLELEGWLGVALFARVRKRLRLTPAGQRYLLALQPLLRQLEAATLDLMSNPNDGGVLRLSVLPTFATKWLIPRLPGFQAAHPKIQLQFVPYVQGYDFERPDLDCAIRYGEGPWKGALCEYVIGRRMMLIASPSRKRTAALKRPADVAGHRLLHHLSVPNAWSDWCRRHGVSDLHPHEGIQLDQYAAIVRAVAAGMGIGLVPECLVEDELARGEVVTPLPPLRGVYEASAGYFLCFPENRASIDTLMAFRTWLKGLAAAPPGGRPPAAGRDAISWTITPPIEKPKRST